MFDVHSFTSAGIAVLSCLTICFCIYLGLVVLGLCVFACLNTADLLKKDIERMALPRELCPPNIDLLFYVRPLFNAAYTPLHIAYHSIR